MSRRRPNIQLKSADDNTVTTTNVSPAGSASQSSPSDSGGALVQSGPSSRSPGLPTAGDSEYNCIPWHDINENDIIFGNIEKKTIQKPGEDPINYNSVPVQYRYGDDGPVDGFFFETPVLMFPKGIGSRVQGGRTTWSLRTVFNPNNDEHNEFMGTVYTKIFKPSVAHCVPHRVRFGVEGLNEENPTISGFKFPISKSRDKETKVIIETSPYSWFLNLVPGNNGTAFILPLTEGQKPVPIPWSKLEGVKFEGVVVMEYRSIYNGGGRVSMQLKTASVIVNKVYKAAPIRNLGTAYRLGTANPHQANDVMSALDELSEQKMEETPDPGQVPPQPSAQSGGSTFAGIPGIPNVARTPGPATAPAGQLNAFYAQAGTPSAASTPSFSHTPSFAIPSTPSQQYN